MGKEQNAGGENNLDVIRQLLQKLEDAARKEGEQQADSAPLGSPALPPQLPETSVLKPVEAPRAARELASLQRSAPALKVVPPEPPASPIVRHIDLDATSEASTRQRPALLLPVVAFLLGVGAAIGVVASFDDIKRLILQAPAPVATADRASDTTVAARTEISEQQPPARETTPEAIDSKASLPVATPPALPGREIAEGPRAATTGSVEAEAPRAAETTPAEQKGSLAIAVATPVMRIGLPDRFVIASGERTPFPLRIEPPAREADGLLLVLRGIPDTMMFSIGSGFGHDIWMLPAHTADGLELTVTEPSLKALHIDAELVALDGRVIARGATNIEVSTAVADATTADTLKLDASAMVRLGAMLLDTGDLAGARMVLERAATGGSAEAALRLAETFDPGQLPGSGLQPAAGDPGAARHWYEKARDLGSTVAAERLQGLAK